MGLLNQLHLFIHQNWSQTRLTKMSTDIVSLSWEPCASIWEPKEPHGSWMGTYSCMHSYTVLLSAWCWTGEATAGCTDRDPLSGATLHRKKLHFPCWTTWCYSLDRIPLTQNLQDGFLIFWAIHSMPWGEQRARNKGQLAVVGLELFSFSLICWDLEPKANECHQTFHHILSPLW